MTEENQYLTMTPDVLQIHIKQISDAIVSQKIDVKQYFGEPITEADKIKIVDHASLSTKVTALETAALLKDNISENEKILAQSAITSLAKEITTIDKDLPIKGILEGAMNPLQKMATLQSIMPIVEYHGQAIAALKATLPEGTTFKQQFSEGGSSGKNAADIIAEMASSQK